MSKIPDINESTSEEWRKLGFFYDHDDKNGLWRFVGSHSGLSRFCDILDRYVANPDNDCLSEHEVYGPYKYLTIETWDSPLIDCMTIKGTFDDFKKLATLIRERLANLDATKKFSIDKEYSADNEYTLEFEVKEEGFDPASADSLLQDQINKTR